MASRKYLKYEGPQKEISGCYIPKKYIAILKERDASFKFPPYMRRLVSESMEQGLFGVYMQEGCVYKENKAEYSRTSVILDEDVVERLFTMFEDKWQQYFTTFPIRPYLYWLIRRDVTGQTDSVLPKKKEPRTPIYTRLSGKRYLEKQQQFSPSVPVADYNMFLEKYGGELAFSTYIKKLLRDGLNQKEFGTFTPPRGTATVSKCITIPKEFAEELAETFRADWENDMEKFPFCKYVYWLMRKDLY